MNSLQLFIHPSKKKLIIEDMQTPKETPDKQTLSKKKGNNLTTNVNVYVSAMNRSKSKESTPCRDKTKRIKYKHSFSSSSLLAQINSLLAESLSQENSKNI